MEQFTKNQRVFALCTVLLSLPFFSLLYKFIDQGEFDQVIALSSIFGAALFLAGFLLGYRDKGSSKFSLGFGYHLITYLIVNLIGVIFLIDYLGLGISTGLIIIGSLFPWGIGLVVHFLSGKMT